MPTLAATTVSLSPTSIDIVPEKSFNVSISINPQGVNNYVEKLELNYPADLLRINSFALSSPWMALSQSGYDLIDNTNGILLKSAGYPAGFSSNTSFGTISFSAKKVGRGTISVGKNSLAFEVNSQSALNGIPVPFIVSLPITDTSKSIPNQNKITILEPRLNITLPETKPANLKPIEQPVATETIPDNTALVGSIGTASTSGVKSAWIGAIAIIIIIAVAIYSFFRKKR